jgi:signal transduction histidine kinase
VQLSQLQAHRDIQQIIEPRLKQVSELLDVRTIRDSQKKIISSEIRQLLDGEIRLLSASFREPTKILQDQSTFRAVSRRKLFTFPDLVEPHLAMKPFLVSLATLAGLPFALYVFQDASWVPVGMLIVAIDFLALALGKLVLQTLKPMSLNRAIASLFIVATVPVLLNYPMLVIAQFPPTPIPYVVLLSAITIYFSMVGFGLVVVHEHNRDSYINQLERNNKRIERELALANQQIWVEKRKWALRIHGTVQASLTAALVRLSRTGTIEDKDIKLIRSHISQARKGLVATDEQFDLAKSIRDIKKTWAGLIDIKINMSSEGARLLLADKWAGVCANEIIKESVSNSMKHGKASRVEISLETTEPGFVRIIAQDNGKGLANQFRPGLGSQILDEIAHPWSLTKVPGGTRLEARIPVARKKKAS